MTTKPKLHPVIRCDVRGCEEPAVTIHDHDYMCQFHADAWVYSEGEAAREREEGEN